MYRKLIGFAFKESMTYRVQFFVGIASAFIQLVVMWYVWNSVFASSGSATIGGFTLQAMITYVVISSALRVFQYSDIEYMLEYHVKTGKISNVITKPWFYPLYILFLDIGYLIFIILSRSVPILLAGFFFLGASLTSNSIAFLVSAGLGYLIMFALSFLTGLWSFWSSGSIWGMKFAKGVISDLLSGVMIPLSLFPTWLSNIASVLPFQAVYYTPISIYVGRISGFDILGSLAVQIFWIAVLFSLCLLVWKKAERRVLSLGG
jgi:ABC-2 type transport system permease protein